LEHVLSIPLGFHSLSTLFVDAACAYAFSLRERREVITRELLVIKRELLVSSLFLSEMILDTFQAFNKARFSRSKMQESHCKSGLRSVAGGGEGRSEKL
jgi:hypothetical protein